MGIKEGGSVTSYNNNTDKNEHYQLQLKKEIGEDFSTKMEK